MPNVEAFMLEYERNGYNGTRAYLTVHPTAKENTAATEAWRILRTPKVAARLEATRKERFERLKMDADEALSRISISARADIRDAFDDQGKLMPVHQWPDNLRLAVKSIRPGPFGDTILLHDGLRAAELMAVAGGKLKNTLILAFDHAKYLGDEPPPEDE